MSSLDTFIRTPDPDCGGRYFFGGRAGDITAHRLGLNMMKVVTILRFIAGLFASGSVTSTSLHVPLDIDPALQFSVQALITHDILIGE